MKKWFLAIASICVTAGLGYWLLRSSSEPQAERRLEPSAQTAIPILQQTGPVYLSPAARPSTPPTLAEMPPSSTAAAIRSAQPSRPDVAPARSSIPETPPGIPPAILL